MADSLANCNGDILVVGSAIATIKVIIVMIIIILALTNVVIIICLLLASYKLRRGIIYNKFYYIFIYTNDCILSWAVNKR